MQTLNFPELRQIYNYDCGACAVCCVLAYYGLDIREEWIMALAKTTSDGTDMTGIASVFSYLGFVTEIKTQMTIDNLCRAIDMNAPTIICLQAYRSELTPYNVNWDDGHYVVAIGYDKSRIYFEDPSSYKRTWLSHQELMDRWHDVDHDKQIYQWGCTVYGVPAYSPGEAIHMD